MASTGTMRGTPSRGGNRGTVPAFPNSPASNIPRPTLETHSTQSEAGGSTMSVSRQKQTKKDEVRGLIGAEEQDAGKTHY